MNDLFKYHGFWSVGVRLFRSLRFVSKAVVISAVFLVVVAQLAFLFIHASGHDIDFAQREVEGLRRVESLSGLLMDSQDLRRLMHAADQPAQAKALQTRRRETEARLDKLAAAMAADPALAEAMKFVQDAYAPLKADMSDRDEAFSRADEFVQQVLRLTAAVSDLSGLSMDPEAASFHLMLAATQEIPTARRMLGRMRDLGADAMREGKLDDFRGRYLQGDTYIMYSQLETLFTRYERVTKDRSDVAATLAVEEALKPINVFMRAARKGPLASGGPRGEMAAYVAAGDAAIASARGLAERSQQVLGQLIEERISRLKQERAIQLGVAAAGLLIAAYFFYCFYLVTRGGLQEVTRHIDAMARGDLSQSPRPWGQDEAAHLMIATRTMQESMRKLVADVRHCADVIVVSTSEVSDGASDLSERTARSSASLQQTASAMEQISTTVGHTAQRTSESAALGEQNAKVARAGGEVIAGVVATMQGLQASSHKISEITGLIDSIAFQTNILALNAAVEAARAGEQGRGFSVVASEVRALAQRSAAAARDIKALIGESVERTTAGSRVAESAGKTMQELLANTQSMSALLASVSTAAAEQTAGISEVTRTVAQLDQDTQNNAVLVQHTSKAADAMTERAQMLVMAAERFTLPPEHTS
jgi:methyl-accepting chemotaxis protein